MSDNVPVPDRRPAALDDATSPIEKQAATTSENFIADTTDASSSSEPVSQLTGHVLPRFPCQDQFQPQPDNDILDVDHLQNYEFLVKKLLED